MKTEIEVKFVKVDIEQMRKKLSDAGAECRTPMRLMRRTIFNSPSGKDRSYVRVRDEGAKVTFTYKQFDDESLHGAKEIEVVVSSYDDTVSILKESGMTIKSIQETRRETWILDEAEVVIDEWPWLEPFIEIEAESEELVRNAVNKLGFDWNDAIFGAVSPAYKASYPNMQNGFSINDYPEIRFDLPVPPELGMRNG